MVAAGALPGLEGGGGGIFRLSLDYVRRAGVRAGRAGAVQRRRAAGGLEAEGGD